MGRPDLDAVQRIVEPIALVPAFDGTGVRVLMDAHSNAVVIRFRDLQPLLADLAAELRAAREVIDRLDPGHLNLAGNRLDPDGLRMRFYAASDALTAYLAAHDRHVQHVQHLDDPGSGDG